MRIFSEIRGREEPKPFGRLLVDSSLIFLLGVALGAFSKFLDCTPSNELPAFLEYLDVRNFLGRFSIWVLLGVWISVRSNSAVRASVNVFLFFCGMVASYYLYSNYVAGFFPKSYAMIWIGFTVLSPLPGFVCWFAGGKEIPAFILSVILLAVLYWCTFVCGWFYILPRSALELLTFLCGVMVLQRDTVKSSIIMTVLAIALGFLLLLLVPFHFG